MNRLDKIIDEASKDSDTRWGAHTVGWLGQWVIQLQDEIEDLKIDKAMLIEERKELVEQQKQWWKQQDSDEQFLDSQEN